MYKDPVKAIEPFQAQVTGSLYGPFAVDRSHGGWPTSWASYNEYPHAEVYLAVLAYHGRTLQLVTLSDNRGTPIEFSELVDMYIDFGQDIERGNYDDDFSDPDSVDREAACRQVHAQISYLLGPEFHRFDDYEEASEREAIVSVLCAPDWDYENGRFPGEPGDLHPWVGPLPYDGPPPVPEKYRTATLEARRPKLP